MKIIWYISSILSIVFILIHNPKLERVSNIGIQGKIFSSTRHANKTLEILTWSSLTFFFIYIVLLNTYK
jgi:preprotein translocase subunit SecG